MESSIADRDFLASIISALCKGGKSALPKLNKQHPAPEVTRAEREGICLTSMMLLDGLGMSQYSSTTKADIFLSIGLLVIRGCISIDYQQTSNKHKGREG